MPEAGGSYAFLRRIYSGAHGTRSLGRFLAFLYVFQLSFSAPLSAASGCIGLSQYATYLWPSLAGHTLLRSVHIGPYTAGVSAGPETLVAITALLLVVFLLYRGLTDLRFATAAMWCSVMALMTWIVLTGALRGHLSQAFAFPPGAFHLTPAFFLGLGSAMMFATYDYWGYYNITFLGSEVKRPQKTIPRAILLSVLFVAAFYVAMNLAVLPSLGSAAEHAATSAVLRVQLVADIASSAFGGWAGYTIAALIVWTAFSSVFSLLLGYSRVPYAAARDGNYFRFLASVHPRHGIPHRSLVALGLVAAAFCFLTLTQVITLLVITRILLQFFLQHLGVMLLRARRPELDRPFKMPLYPLPPLIAMAGFAFVLVNRSHALEGLAVAMGIALSGTAIYLWRASRLGQWPFAPAK
jgi:amino acid transporter